MSGEHQVNPPDFVGNNEFRLNAATMKDIVQFWLAYKWAGTAPKVDYISTDSTGGPPVFTVRLIADPKE